MGFRRGIRSTIRALLINRRYSIMARSINRPVVFSLIRLGIPNREVQANALVLELGVEMRWSLGSRGGRFGELRLSNPIMDILLNRN